MVTTAPASVPEEADYGRASSRRQSLIVAMKTMTMNRPSPRKVVRTLSMHLPWNRDRRSARLFHARRLCITWRHLANLQARIRRTHSTRHLLPIKSANLART